MNPLSKYFFLTSDEREALLLDIASQRLAQIPGALQRFRSDTLFKLYMNVNPTLNDWFNTEEGFRISALRLVDKWAADNCNPLTVPPLAITSADAEPATEDPTVDTTGLVAWQAATRENWRQITEKYGSTPTAREVMSWLRGNGPRDVFPEQQNERNRLLWIDTYGMRQTVSYSRVASVLSAWRKSGKIAAR